MKYILTITIIALLLGACTKEVEVDIPGYEEKLVIDGRIETGRPPIILLSKSKEVYAETDLETFLNGFISGATVTVSNGTTTVVLDEICSDNLPPGTEELAAEMLGIPVDQLQNYNICAYTSLNPAIWGEIGKTYTLTVNYDGETYTGETRILAPTPLSSSFWQPESGLTNHGFSWVTLADPANQFDAYFWEVNRIGTASGNSDDTGFTPTYSPVFNDDFFDGLTFDFWYENPFAFGSTPDSIQGMYARGDTVVIKFSKIDPTSYEYYEKKYTQLQTAGNPFATPTNIPNNLSNGALGIWAGFSPTYDTLICVQ